MRVLVSLGSSACFLAPAGTAFSGRPTPLLEGLAPTEVAFLIQRVSAPEESLYSRAQARRYSPPAVLFPRAFKNVPSCNSRNASRNCPCVFITIGPYHATGSSSGLPDTSRKRMPSSPACTINSSPRSNNTSERLSASEGGGAVSSHPTGSVGTSSGSDALQNFPAPANTYANACRVTSTGSVLRRPGGTLTSIYIGSAAMPFTGPRLPQ